MTFTLRAMSAPDDDGGVLQSMDAEEDGVTTPCMPELGHRRRLWGLNFEVSHNAIPDPPYPLNVCLLKSSGGAVVLLDEVDGATVVQAIMR